MRNACESRSIPGCVSLLEGRGKVTLRLAGSRVFEDEAEGRVYRQHGLAAVEEKRRPREHFDVGFPLTPEDLEGGWWLYGHRLCSDGEEPNNSDRLHSLKPRR